MTDTLTINIDCSSLIWAYWIVEISFSIWSKSMNDSSLRRQNLRSWSIRRNPCLLYFCHSYIRVHKNEKNKNICLIKIKNWKRKTQFIHFAFHLFQLTKNDWCCFRRTDVAHPRIRSFEFTKVNSFLWNRIKCRE